MDSQQWPDELRHKLREQNLPPAYIDRLVAELSDHLLDTQTENPSMEAQQAVDRLGNIQQLAAAASHEVCRTTFAGRHPYVSFVCGPIALVPFLFICLLFGPYCILATLDGLFALVTGNALLPAQEEPTTLFPSWAAYAYHYFFRFVPFAIAAAIFCRWGRNVGMHRWAMVACGIVAVMAAATVSHVRPVDGNFAEWMCGLGLRPSFGQLIQLLVPLAIAAMLLRRLPQRLLAIGPTPNPTAT